MKIKTILIWTVISSLFLLTIIFGFVDTEEFKIVISILIMLFLMALCVEVIKKTNPDYPLLSDGRVYFIGFLTLYSIWVPILSIVSDIGSTSFASLEIYGADRYSAEDMLRTTFTSIFLLTGILLGFLLTNKVNKSNYQKNDSFQDLLLFSRKNYTIWFLIATVSTLLYLMPFFQGGFLAIREGGSILDVEAIASSSEGNIITTILLFFFSPEVMTISTATFFLYYLNSKESINKKFIVSILILLLHLVLVFLTTRSARFIIILTCFIAIVFKNKSLRQNKFFKLIISFTPLIGIVVYALDYIVVNQVRNELLDSNDNIIEEIMRRFDGVGPYDALFKAINDSPNIEMITNIFYSLFRPIPVIGNILTDFLGMSSEFSPLYNWMASQYPVIYATGGGLAYMPQIEAYLTFGLMGCLLYGIVFGVIFGRNQTGIKNIIVIAMGLMLARGSFGVIASLTIPYILISYFLYHNLLLKLYIKRGRKKHIEK